MTLLYETDLDILKMDLHTKNKAFIDIRLHPGITTPLVVVG